MVANTEPQIPDPNGPPQALASVGKIAKYFGWPSVLALVGGTATLLLIATSPTRTLGALRSQRIKWEERKKEIARVQVESDAAEENASARSEEAGRE